MCDAKLNLKYHPQCWGDLHGNRDFNFNVWHYLSKSDFNFNVQYGTIDQIVISILMCDTIYWIVISILMYGTIDWIVIAISMYRTIYRIVIAISLYGIIYWIVIAISMFCCTGWVGCPPSLEKMTWRPYRTSPAVTGSSLRRRSLRSLLRPRTSSDDSWSGDLSK